MICGELTGVLDFESIGRKYTLFYHTRHRRLQDMAVSSPSLPPVLLRFPFFFVVYSNLLLYIYYIITPSAVNLQSPQGTLFGLLLVRFSMLCDIALNAFVVNTPSNILQQPTIREAPPLVKRTTAHEESFRIRRHLGHSELWRSSIIYSCLRLDGRHQQRRVLCSSPFQPSAFVCFSPFLSLLYIQDTHCRYSRISFASGLKYWCYPWSVFIMTGRYRLCRTSLHVLRIGFKF